MQTLKEALITKKNINSITLFSGIKDLRNGDIIEVNCGNIYMASIKDNFIDAAIGENNMAYRDGGFLYLKNYDPLTLSFKNDEFDIVKVYRPRKLKNHYTQNELTKEYLKNLIKQSDIIFER